MIKISNIEVFGWEAAIRGMRNPLESWEKSDSTWGIGEDPEPINPNDFLEFHLGPNDHDLAMRLAKAGSAHAKYRRMIHVQCDILAPLYWWKEMETYRVGCAENPTDIEWDSCSTMHKIHAKEFALDDFSYEHLMTDSKTAGTELVDTSGLGTDILVTPKSWLNITIGLLNNFRKRYLETKDKEWWWQMIQLLPSTYDQLRTVDTNYQALSGMYRDRKNHKLDEWRTFCNMIESLPYSDLITTEEE